MQTELLNRVLEQEQRVKRFLIGRVGQADADDIWQELLIKVAANPEFPYAEQGKLPAFLMVSARNAANDLFRRRQAENLLAVDELSDRQLMGAQLVVRPRGIYGLSPMMNDALSMLKAHSVRQFKAIYLRYVRGWDSALGAEELGISCAAERKLVQRGLEFLRMVLS